MRKYPNVAVKIIFRYKNKTLILEHKNSVFSFLGRAVIVLMAVFFISVRNYFTHQNSNFRLKIEGNWGCG